MKNHALYNYSCHHLIVALLLLGLHTQSFTAAVENPYTLNPLHVAAIEGDIDAARNIIENDPGTLTQKDSLGWTALHFVAKHGHHTLAQYFIEKSPTLFSQPDRAGWTPLHVAAANGHDDIVRLIVEKDPTTLTQEAANELTPGNLAKINKNNNIVEYMATINAQHTPLHNATKTGNLDVVKQIIETDPTMLTQKDCQGITPLQLAVKHGYFDIVQYILEKYPDLITQKTHDKNTLLHLAVAMGHLPIVKYIGDKNPSLHNQKDQYGQLPLHAAAATKRLDIVKTILQTYKSIDFRAKTIKKHNIINQTPLDTREKLARLLIEHLVNLYNLNPIGHDIQCIVCLENVVQPGIHTLTSRARVFLTPCCLNILCGHDYDTIVKSESPQCPNCRDSWQL